MNRKSKNILLISIIVLLVTSLIVTFYLGYNHQSKKTSTTQTSIADNRKSKNIDSNTTKKKSKSTSESEETTTSEEKETSMETEDNTKTSIDRVYAGGDAVSGAATVILAMQAGKNAATEIMNL